MREIIILVVGILGLVLSVGCAAPAATPTTLPPTAERPTREIVIPVATPSNVGQPPESYALKDVSMTLERTACFGTCPMYTVTVRGDGTVNYNGEKFVKVEGAQTRTISQEAVFELLKLYYESDFFNFRDEYLQGRTVQLEADGMVKESGLMVTDLPTTIVTIQIGEYRKSVRAYFQAPDAVYTVATKIDETAGTAEWVRTP